MRVGAFDVQVLVDGEGTFATVGQTFPALDATEEWRLPVNTVLIRGAGTTVLVGTGFGSVISTGPDSSASAPRGSAGRALQRRARLPSNRGPCRSGTD